MNGKKAVAFPLLFYLLVAVFHCGGEKHAETGLEQIKITSVPFMLASRVPITQENIEQNPRSFTKTVNDSRLFSAIDKSYDRLKKIGDITKESHYPHIQVLLSLKYRDGRTEFLSFGRIRDKMYVKDGLHAANFDMELYRLIVRQLPDVHRKGMPDASES